MEQLTTPLILWIHKLLYIHKLLRRTGRKPNNSLKPYKVYQRMLFPHIWKQACGVTDLRKTTEAAFKNIGAHIAEQYTHV